MEDKECLKYADVILKLDDLYECDAGLNKIGVNKEAFNDFMKNKKISIGFIDEGFDHLFSFIMVSQNIDTIYMQRI